MSDDWFIRQMNSYRCGSKQSAISKSVRILGKIPQLSVSTLIDTYPAHIPKTQADYFRVYTGVSVLFIGDASIRTLYFDTIKMLSSGHLLDDSEAARQSAHDVVLFGS